MRAMTYDRFDIGSRIADIQTTAGRLGAALALHPSFWRLDAREQANRLDETMGVLEERLQDVYSDVFITEVA